MARPTTISKAWRALLDRAGGVVALCNTLDMTGSTFYRATRGMIPFPEDKRNALEILCELYELPNPLEAGPKPWNRDLTPLRLLGDAMSRGFPASPRIVSRLKQSYPTEQLIRLAEGEDTPEAILRACVALLEDE